MGGGREGLESYIPKYQQQLSLDGTAMGNFEFLLYELLRKLNLLLQAYINSMIRNII